MRVITASVTATAALSILLCACEEDRPELTPATGTKPPTEELKPPEQAPPVNFSETAVKEIGGVKFAVEAGFWPGAADIKTELTPLRIIVNNESDRTIRIDYDQMRLVDDDGEVFSALPPFEIDDDAPQLVTVRDTEVVPAWTGEEYEVISVYDPAYGDDVVIYEEKVYPDIDYYTEYYSYWVDRELPTAEMLTRALPEGVLNPKGKLDGWVYFEQVDEDEELAEFSASLINAKTGRRFGQVRIPFVIQEIE